MKCVTIEALEKRECSGCEACAQLCPVKCISMKEDEEGFYYPVVDAEKCISCGKCLKQCPQYNILQGNTESDCYALVHSDKSVLKSSTSGGAFSIFAEKVLQENGVIYGCAMKKSTFAVSHMRAENYQELEELKGSKYVQSRIEDTYTQAKRDLEEGRTVLFSGTPCQIAGLKAFLKKDYDKLFTCEVICHGVPSQRLWQKNIEYLSSVQNAEITSIKLRTKARKWAMYWEYSYQRDAAKASCTAVKIADQNQYYMAFLRGESYRESCYACNYARKERISDITLGDYWGVDVFNPDFADPDGVSLVLLNSSKAKKLVNYIKQNAKVIPVSFDNAIKYNKNLVAPTPRPQKRDVAYKNISLDAKTIFESEPYALSFKSKVKGLAKSFISVEFKWRIKKFLKLIKLK